MNSGTKRGQFQRQSGGLLACVSPSYLLVFVAALFGVIGYHSWTQSSRMERCRVELARYRSMLQEAHQQKILMDGRITELRNIMEKRAKLLSVGRDSNPGKKDDKESRVLQLETELVQVKEKLDRCGNMAFRAQSRIEEAEANSKTSPVIRNKTQCDIEIARQYDEIDKWIKSMLDDRTYSQFQMKFGKDGEKTEAEKMQRLEKVVMQRDEIKAAKDERVKEEIRVREAKLEAQQKLQKLQPQQLQPQQKEQKGEELNEQKAEEPPPRGSRADLRGHQFRFPHDRVYGRPEKAVVMVDPRFQKDETSETRKSERKVVKADPEEEKEARKEKQKRRKDTSGSKPLSKKSRLLQRPPKQPVK